MLIYLNYFFILQESYFFVFILFKNDYLIGLKKHDIVF